MSEAEFADRLVQGKVRGRGAGLNPGNRFETIRLHVLGEHLEEVLSENPDGTQVRTQVYTDTSRTIINPVDSPDIGFKWTINPYRGCEHGCIYCYARPGHEMLGMSSGLDFETKIVAKRDGPELLREALMKPFWKGENIVMSGVTDPYQPVEAKLRITRRIIEVCCEFNQPLSFITKNHLITRDIDLFKRLAEHGAVSAAISITTLDPRTTRIMEPRASTPRDRLATVRELSAAGIPVHVMVAPIVPGITDHETPAILEAAAKAGASGAGYVLLRLPHQNKELFLNWLREHFPDRAAKVENKIREMRGGKLYNAAWFERGKGTGIMADQLGINFKMFLRRYGLDKPAPRRSGSAFRRPARTGEGNQPFLFAV
ncbi:MAG: PA0069 family radical SAM protein [Phycisphaerales bacterium]|nr:PA0069 family radical SAM protein [Phycisphaerales bacterium]